ncbi:MAG TPA: chromate efflux transporter [Burkholderiaceae bacterium]|nr:chromate efflux transporter [Burkholderiaceae bacterium]
MNIEKNATVPFLEALKFWFKLGWISFGGPAGQIAIMHKELVDDKHWISEKRFLHALNYCMVLPGPEAQQLSIYIGWLLHRTWGGIVAGVLFVLPSLFILIGLSYIYVAFGNLPWVAALLYGIKPAVAAIVVQAVHRIGSKTLKTPSKAPILWTVAVASFVGLYFFSVPFPLIVLLAAFVGYAGSKFAPTQFTSVGGHGSKSVSNTHVAAVIDDDTPTPEHAKFKKSRLALVIGICLVLWLLPMGVLMSYQGWQGTLTQMSWFFTKAALLTFGGAYAVLPYVYDGGVNQFAWLSGAQMMDGLALGETTPGPLIMVVSFVAFLGGWSKQVLGPDALFLGAALAATLTTWFTFLPSFMFILAGGPLVETTHNNLKFTAPLTVITAAVVGVIASLALFFIAHIALKASNIGFQFTNIDFFALGLAGIATLALIRYKVSVMSVLFACAICGLLYRTWI